MTAVAFSDDGSTLASTGADQTIVLHDVATGKTLRRLIGHEGEVWGIAFSPNGKSLVSGSKYDGTVKVWPLDRETGAPAYVSAFLGLAFVGSGRELVGWSHREGFSRFDIKSGHRTRLESRSVPVEFDPERFFETRLSSDLNFLANIHGSAVEIWNLRSGRCEQILRHTEGAITALAFSVDASLLATAGENSEVRIWHTRDWSAKVLSGVIPGTASLGAVSFSPQGNRLAARIGATCYVFDLRAETPPIELHPFGDIHFTFSPDGNRIAVGSRSNFIELWDITAKKQVAALRGHMAGVLGLSFAPGGRTLASCSNDNFVRLWSLNPLAEVLRLPGIRAASGEVMFSPDGNSIVANSSGERMQIWRAPSWEEIAAAEETQAVITGSP